jgi:MFS family permease
MACAASTPPWGKISDIFGRKPMLLLANFLFFVGSLICGVSINIKMLLAGRVVQGLGGGGLLTLVNICIGDLFSMRARGAYYGFVGGVWAIAGAIGPVLGGAFTEYVNWR